MSFGFPAFEGFPPTRASWGRDLRSEDDARWHRSNRALLKGAVPSPRLAVLDAQAFAWALWRLAQDLPTVRVLMFEPVRSPAPPLSVPEQAPLVSLALGGPSGQMPLTTPALQALEDAFQAFDQHAPAGARLFRNQGLWRAVHLDDTCGRLGGEEWWHACRRDQLDRALPDAPPSPRRPRI